MIIQVLLIASCFIGTICSMEKKKTVRPQQQKEYIYNRETNSFEEWKKNLYTASDKHHATEFKDLLDNPPKKLGSKEVSTLRSNLEINRHTFITLFIGLAGVAILYGSGNAITTSSDNDVRIKAIPCAIAGTIVSGMSCAYYEERRTKKKKHEPIDTILADKIKQLQELEKKPE